MHVSAFEGNLQLVKHLLDRGINVDQIDNIGLTPLIYAATHGHNDVIKLLINHGADINHVNKVSIAFTAFEKSIKQCSMGKNH